VRERTDKLVRHVVLNDAAATPPSRRELSGAFNYLQNGAVEDGPELFGNETANYPPVPVFTSREANLHAYGSKR
jgi:hypothetical protein